MGLSTVHITVLLVQCYLSIAASEHREQLEMVDVYHKMVGGLHSLWQVFEFLQLVLCTCHTAQCWSLSTSFNDTWYQHLQQLQHQRRRLAVTLNTSHSITSHAQQRADWSSRFRTIYILLRVQFHWADHLRITNYTVMGSSHPGVLFTKKLRKIPNFSLCSS